MKEKIVKWAVGVACLKFDSSKSPEAFGELRCICKQANHEPCSDTVLKIHPTATGSF